MTWLDRVVAVPTIELVFAQRMKSTHTLLEGCQPFLSKLAAKHQVSVANNGPMHLQMQSASGFAYDMALGTITITFQYRVELSRRGGIHVAESKPEPRPYSELLAETVEPLKELTLPYIREKPLELARLGVVADARMSPESVPPGVDAFLSHIGRPWKQRPAICNATVTTELPNTDKPEPDLRVRCHHFVDWNTVDAPLTVSTKLDWQGMFEPVRKVSAVSDLEALVRNCQARALEYYDRFGMGELDYGEDQ